MIYYNIIRVNMLSAGVVDPGNQTHTLLPLVADQQLASFTHLGFLISYRIFLH